MEKDWIEKEITKIAEKADYETKALLEYVLTYTIEQQHRIDMEKAKLDGQLWSPKKW